MANKERCGKVNQIHNRLDTTSIDKLTDVSTSIKQMLKKFTKKRLSRQEQTDEVIFGKLRERQIEIDTVYKELQKEIQQTEKRLLIEIKSLKLTLAGELVH